MHLYLEVRVSHNTQLFKQYSTELPQGFLYQQNDAFCFILNPFS